jgi:transposase
MDVLKDENQVRRVGGVGNYTREFIRQVLEEVEGGHSQRAVCLKYNLPERTLGYWLKKYVSEAHRQSRRKFATIHVKRAVARAVQNGSMTIGEAMITCNLRSGTTIREWIKLENKEMNELVGSNPSALNKEETKDQSSDQGPGDEVEELRKKLADAQLKIAALNTLIDVAEEQLKINIRKKPGAKRL